MVRKCDYNIVDASTQAICKVQVSYNLQDYPKLEDNLRITYIIKYPQVIMPTREKTEVTLVLGYMKTPAKIDTYLS